MPIVIAAAEMDPATRRTLRERRSIVSITSAAALGAVINLAMGAQMPKSVIATEPRRFRGQKSPS